MYKNASSLWAEERANKKKKRTPHHVISTGHMRSNPNPNLRVSQSNATQWWEWVTMEATSRGSCQEALASKVLVSKHSG
jgi:hypothetical protein